MARRRITRSRKPILLATLMVALVALTAPAVAADAPTPPGPPIVWLHYDYMVADDHSHEPDPTAIDAIVQAFRRQGIVLHVDPHHAVIPETRYLVFEGHTVPCEAWGGTEAANFFELKAQYFHPSGSQPWHYAIIGHDTGGSLGCGIVGGTAALPGYDFMVLSGRLFELAMSPEARAEALYLFTAGVTMHELGHNLALHHGGGDDVDAKPNYISVVNTNYSFGIPYAAVPGSADVAGYRFDYSSRALPTLDERDLDETLGIQGDTTDIIVYPCPDFSWAAASATGAIDWNCNGAIERDVAADIGGYGWGCFWGGCEGPLLRGWDDWAAVHEFIRSPAYVSGTLRRGSPVP